MATQGDGASDLPRFGEVLGTRDPAAIQQEMFARLEQARLDHIAATQTSAAADRKVLEAAMKDVADRVPPERLRRLAGLIGLVTEQADQAAAAARAVKKPPSVPAGGWLVFGQVRDSDGAPAKGGQINFEGGSDVASRLLKPVKIGADGQARLALDAGAVAEIGKNGEVEVVVTAQVEDRTVRDIAPARITADGLHQFDLILPAPKGSAKRR
jgi:hypothetical protein